ncbi:MAG: lipocalin family protein [Thermoanaerobaculaceae bacterium]
MRSLLLIGMLLLGWGCTGVPEGVQAVRGFELDRYLGTWYEIARLDHSFERGLERVTATYAPRDGSGITVTNRGFDPGKGAWKEATGKAFPAGEPGEGRLKVSFFGPFYGGYNVIALDSEGYQWAMVCGPSRDYLWILARTPALDPEIRERLVGEARALGFPTEQLIAVKHE